MLDFLLENNIFLLLISILGAIVSLSLKILREPQLFFKNEKVIRLNLYLEINIHILSAIVVFCGVVLLFRGNHFSEYGDYKDFFSVLLATFGSSLFPTIQKTIDIIVDSKVEALKIKLNAPIRDTNAKQKKSDEKVLDENKKPTKPP